MSDEPESLPLGKRDYYGFLGVTFEARRLGREQARL
jgi:hypothetical protein